MDQCLYNTLFIFFLQQIEIYCSFQSGDKGVFINFLLKYNTYRHFFPFFTFFSPLYVRMYVLKIFT